MYVIVMTFYIHMIILDFNFNLWGGKWKWVFFLPILFNNTSFKIERIAEVEENVKKAKAHKMYYN